MSQTIRLKLSTIINEQKDHHSLAKLGLPKVPNLYQPPLIQNHIKGKNQPICSNDAHTKATNNGYNRNALGGFFAH
jgi:hypothetical protein